MVEIGLSNPLAQNMLPKEVNKRGAVSPDILAIESKTPVIMPLLAVPRTMYKVVFHFGIPSAREASLIEPGTSLRASSVVLVTIGIIKTDNATPPAKAEKLPKTGTPSIVAGMFGYTFIVLYFG